MFCLIIFSLVMMATMNRNFMNLILGDGAAAGWDVRVDAGTANPVENFRVALQDTGVDTSQIVAYGRTTIPDAASQIRLRGGAWKQTTIKGMDADFISNSSLTFKQRARGYNSDAEIVQALLTQPGVAIIDSSAVSNPSSLGGADDIFQLDGVRWNDDVFDPTTIDVTDPKQPIPAALTIIGVLDPSIGSLIGLFANQATLDTIFSGNTATSYYLQLTDHEQATAIAKSIERAMLPSGVQAVSVRDELEDLQQQGRGILYLMEGFMGLGLVVGVAAVGVIAFRTVVERRQQIGVLRAIGFPRRLVAASFLIETGFIVGSGIIMGTILGLLLAHNVFTSDLWGSSNAGFTIPWALIAVIGIVTVVAAELMAWIPAQRAARIAPAEALRYE